MKKKYEYLILLLAVFCGITGEVKCEENFQGNVKSVKQTAYQVIEKFGEATKGEVSDVAVWKYDEKKRLLEEPSKKYRYDSNGNKTEEITYNSAGNIESSIVWTYNEKNKKIEENSYDSNKKLITKTKWKYDDLGNMIDESEYDADGKLVKREIRVFDKDRFLEHSWYSRYNDEVTLSSRCIHQFDNKGNNIKDVLLGQKDTLCVRTYKYDIHGNEIEAFWDIGEHIYCKMFSKYNEKGTLIELRVDNTQFVDPWDNTATYGNYSDSYSIIIYNDEGNTIREGQYNPNGLYLHKYDEKGNIIKKMECNDGTHDDDDDENGYFKGESNLEEFLTTTSDTRKEQLLAFFEKRFEKKTEYTYTFDKNGNWIKQIEYTTEKNKVPVCTQIVEREIVYWE